ncbi:MULTISPECIES: hypothetical protein [unclassified Gordonia (in: high G+C Gram-positive bacteria)]|uniref:hypothetical protein n=1 Tax=unclassified Gordonia (in: high G+C Gram-positive bacteria) TaxID=2657482 RepID=UPI001FFF95FE|nr:MULTISPECIES: hypothetical protein [unclassified Gordonia (in: high G+C Gram-positive bacteria)]UQE75155.1 hypothetical protein MYK68_00465 [Gordonia sp. PP30]
MHAAFPSDRGRRRGGRTAARTFWGRVRAPRPLAAEHERLVTTEEFRRLRRAG